MSLWRETTSCEFFFIGVVSINRQHYYIYSEYSCLVQSCLHLAAKLQKQQGHYQLRIVREAFDSLLRSPLPLLCKWEILLLYSKRHASPEIRPLGGSHL